GDLRVFGAHPVPIRLRLPDDPAACVPALSLQNGSLATSANYFNPRIIDPASRERWASASSVSVAAPACVLADALTKVVALSGCAASQLLCQYGAEALVVTVAD